MSTARLQEIEEKIAVLTAEKSHLEKILQQRKEEKWSEEGMTSFLKKTILSRYGSVHNIKIAKLILNASPSMGGYVYQPILLLFDENVNEVEHDIDVKDFAPTFEQQKEYNDKMGVAPYRGSITLRYT